MKSQTRLRLALATFAFGLAASVGVNATDVCTRCENNYQSCQATGTNEAQCYQWYLECTGFGAGHRPCPAPR
ncbi:hypothetical protein J5226_19800 [Lysobacter sp. K5869]|uniref:hypothetical protein n=1 Tax=Lysobacter sp. K5869 TaxID=2820808 RepID=UPI001C064960|nr:hypothetical protein [Lysobacter sp. K5869]QWP75830.1 hypothetical protein J5226_19800 [Lysobacter sp. K5869]